MDADYPILEFDPAPQAVIEPSRYYHAMDISRHAVACFFQEVFDHLIERHGATVVRHLESEMGRHPVYQMQIDDQPLIVFHPGVGAPLAAGFLEAVIAMGCTSIIACGGAGVLDSSIVLGHPVVVTSAVRDEGTSYHYLPPSREVESSPMATTAIENVLQEYGVDYLKGKTWTTDGFYRETRERVKRRREEGCLTVDMEAAAFFAVAQFRGVTCGQILYGGDDVSGDEHDNRDWTRQRGVREQLFWFAAKACLRL